MRSHIQQVLEQYGSPLRVKRKSVTSAFTLSSDDIGCTVDNTGATASVTVTLPTGPGAGVRYRFVVTAAYALRVDPASDDGFFFDGSQRMDGYYLELSGIGTWLDVESDVNGNWVARCSGTILPQ